MVETSLEAVAVCGAALLSDAFAPVPSPSDRGFLNSSPLRLADNNPLPGLRTRICKSLPETVELLPLRFCRSMPSFGAIDPALWNQTHASPARDNSVGKPSLAEVGMIGDDDLEAGRQLLPYVRNELE
jgi:hypothetical protein